ncbi:MAG: tetratricopeptide repeat protein [Bdellovibrio sp.]|nr:MAG: tetratricopeptide repeat protein [Bdellovibrio sp.]
MKKHSLVVLVLFITCISRPLCLQAKIPKENYQTLLEDKNDLALRTYILSRIPKAYKDPEEWVFVRHLLHKRPNIGFDLLYFWDQKRPKRIPKQKIIKKIDRLLKKADRLMLNKRFLKAFFLYQKILRYVEKKNPSKDNEFLIFSLIHSMARALYGAGRFKDSLRAYNWIDQRYPLYRKVLFEKTWAAFRAGRVDLALGAIASQNSSYFSKYLNPEAYLLQMYLYKKLCREKEINMIRKQLKQFQQDLKNNSFDYKQWATSDIETFALLKLSQQEIKPTPFVTRSQLQKEQSYITQLLKKLFKEEKPKLLKQIDKAISFSYLTLSPNSKKLPPIKKLPSQKKLLESGLEMWPVDDAEDWVDEIGKHRFIGRSKCH